MSQFDGAERLLAEIRNETDVEGLRAMATVAVVTLEGYKAIIGDVEHKARAEATPETLPIVESVLAMTREGEQFVIKSVAAALIKNLLGD